MEKTSPFLRNGTFTKRVFISGFSAAMGTRLVDFINSYTDSLLAGALINESAVSAVALIQPLTPIIIFFSYLLSAGAVTLFYRECGAFHKERAYQYVGQSLICAIGLSAFLLGFMLVLREPYLRFYGASQEVTALAREYYGCEIFYAVTCPVYYLLFQLVGAEGDDKLSFFASAMSALVNFLSSILLIKPFGIQGLVYGSMIGTLLGMALYSIHFFRKNNSIHYIWHFDFKELKEVAFLGSCTSLTYLYIALTDIILNRFIINRFSESYLPAYVVVNLLLTLASQFGALYDGVSGMVNIAYGEKNPDAIQRTMDISRKALYILSGVFFFILEILARTLPDVYGITDPEVRRAAIWATHIIPMAFPASAAYYLLCYYYPIVDRVGLGQIYSFLYMFFFPMALTHPLALLFGFNGISIGLALACYASAIFMYFYIRKRYGKKAVPLVLEETTGDNLAYEITLTAENISALCQEIHKELTARNIAPSVVFEVQLILEEGYMSILQRNAGKTIYTECNLLIDNGFLRLITRDDGEIFNITDSNAKVKDLRSYVLAQLMDQNSGRANAITISYNRNNYLWQWEI